MSAPRVTWRKAPKGSWGLQAVGVDLCVGGARKACVRLNGEGRWYWYAIGGWISFNSLGEGHRFASEADARQHCRDTWNAHAAKQEATR